MSASLRSGGGPVLASRIRSQRSRPRAQSAAAAAAAAASSPGAGAGTVSSDAGSPPHSPATSARKQAANASPDVRPTGSTHTRNARRCAAGCCMAAARRPQEAADARARTKLPVLYYRAENCNKMNEATPGALSEKNPPQSAQKLRAPDDMCANANTCRRRRLRHGGGLAAIHYRSIATGSG